MANNPETTTKFKVDISELKSGIQEANRQIRLANAEFKAASSGMDDWGSSTDGVSAKIKQLESVLEAENKKLENLKKQLELVEKEQGENSKGADELRIAIANQQAAVNKTEKSLNGYKGKLDELESGIDDVAEASKDAEDATESLGDGFTVLKGAAASLIADGIKNIIGSITGMVAESREFRNEMSKLETAFTTGGHSVESAKNTYQDFYAILGDEGQATEAVSFLAKMTSSEQDLAKWTEICTGVYGEFGASLPLESLTEASNETAKVGQVTGALADALNWTGVTAEDLGLKLKANTEENEEWNKAIKEGASSEDLFNMALSECSTEQERQQLIMQTLNDLYGESANKFREANGEVMEANKAQAELTQTMADLSAKAEPVVTAVKQGFAELLQSVLGLVDGADFSALADNIKSGFDNFITNILPVLKEGFQWIIDNKDALIAGIAGIAAGFVAFNVVSMIQGVVGAFKAFKAAQEGATIAQWLLNAAMNANPIGLIIAAITALVTGFVLLWNNCEGFRNFFIGMWENIQTAFSAFMEFISPAIETIKGFFLSLWESIQVAFGAIMETLQPVIDSMVGAFQEGWELIKVVWDIVQPYFSAIWEKIQKVFSVVKSILSSYFKVAWEAIKAIWDNVSAYFQMVWENIKAVFSVVKTFFEGMFKTAWEAIKAVWNAVTGYFKQIWDTIKGIFSVVKSVLTGNWKDAWEGIKGIVSGWASYFTGVWESIKGVFSAVKTWFSTTFSAAWTAIKSVFSNVKTFFSTVWTNIKNVFSKAKTEFLSVGKNIIAGIKEGISNAWKNLKTWFSGLFDDLIGIAKRILGIKSPSRVFRDQIGKQIVLGLVQGIDKLKSRVTDVITNMLTDTRTEAQKVMDEMNAELLESEQKYADESIRLAESTSDADKAYLEELKKNAETERKIYDARQKDIENNKKKILSAYQDIADGIFDNIQDIKDAQDSMYDKLTNYGSLYSERVVEIMNGTELKVNKLDDLGRQNKELEEYYNMLMEIKNRANVPTEFFTELRDMSIEDGIEFSKVLINASAEDFDKYIADWKERRKTAQQLSKLLYADEAESIAKEINGVSEQIESDMYNVGLDSADKFGVGFLEEFKVVMAEIASALGEGLNGIVSSAFDSSAFLNGFNSEIKTVGYSPYISNLPNSVQYNFTQNNNSPKALDNLTIYRQSKNLFSTFAGIR